MQQQKEVIRPASLEEIIQILREFDGSGTEWMTTQQVYAACQQIPNLGFTEQELQDYITKSLQSAGDENGNIKVQLFASQLAFDANIRFNETNDTLNEQQSIQLNNNVNVYDEYNEHESDKQQDHIPLEVETKPHDPFMQQLIQDLQLISNYEATDLQMDIENELREILIQYTQLPEVICMKMMGYLPLQYQFIRINMIKYDTKYSLMEFALTFVNNLMHYMISIVLMILTTYNMMNISIPFIIFSILETIVIAHDYNKRNYPFTSVEKGRIIAEILRFYNYHHVTMLILVNIPMTIIMMVIKPNEYLSKISYVVLLILYFLSLVILILFKCFMYKRRSIFEHETVSRLNEYAKGAIFEAPSYIYLTIIAFIPLLFGIFYHDSFAIIIIALFVIYISFILNALIKNMLNWYLCHKASCIYFTLIYIQLSCLCLLGTQLWSSSTVDLNIVGIVMISLSFIEIAVFYWLIIKLWKQYYIDHHYISPTDRDDWYVREEAFLWYRGVIEICIHIPMYIILIYYMYSNIENLTVLWYICMASFSVSKLFHPFYYVSVKHGDFALSATECTLYTSYQFVANLIFGIIWISAFKLSFDSNNILFVTTIILMIFGGISCIICGPLTYVWIYSAGWAFYDDE